MYPFTDIVLNTAIKLDKVGLWYPYFNLLSSPILRKWTCVCVCVSQEKVFHSMLDFLEILGSDMSGLIEDEVLVAFLMNMSQALLTLLQLLLTRNTSIHSFLQQWADTLQS